MSKAFAHLYTHRDVSKRIIWIEVELLWCVCWWIIQSALIPGSPDTKSVNSRLPLPGIFESFPGVPGKNFREIADSRNSRNSRDPLSPPPGYFRCHNSAKSFQKLITYNDLTVYTANYWWLAHVRTFRNDNSMTPGLVGIPKHDQRPDKCSKECSNYTHNIQHSHWQHNQQQQWRM